MRAAFEKVDLRGGGFFALKTRHDPQFEFAWHYHPEFELTLITDSSGRRFVGDNIADYTTGDLVLIGPNLPHTWCSFPTQRPRRHGAIVVQFKADFLGPQGLQGPGLLRLRRLLDRARLGITFGGASRDRVVRRLAALSDLTALGQLAEFLCVLDELGDATDGRTLSTRTFDVEGPGSKNHPIDVVCRHLNQRFREPLTLPGVARLAALSPSAFSRFFHRTTGKTFSAYLNEIRIGEACRLLMETERGIFDIADASGFTNLSNFNRQFLKVRGQRPSAFRREHRVPVSIPWRA